MLTKIKESYNITIYASFIGYVTQAIIINFAPLLFVTFQKDYDISLASLSLLVLISFLIQLLTDLFSVYIVDKLGYRKCIVSAHILCFLGLILLAFLPTVMHNKFSGILIATVFYACGGGLIEVLVSAIVEACPTKKKASIMSLLHSFYCWGFLAVVLLSTAFFSVFGVKNWKVLSCLWAVIPLINSLLFMIVPINTLETVREGYSVKELLKMKVFWFMLLLMCAAGASEQSVSQWISAYAEEGLNISKTMGDLLGGCLFALLMGISRIIYSKNSDRISLKKYMIFSAFMLLIAYAMTALSPIPLIGLIGCGLCGFFSSIMWPGIYSLSAGKIKGGTSMFALLALSGDLGCSLGPAMVGTVSDSFNGNLSIGIIASAIFPLILFLGLISDKKSKTKNGSV